MQEKSEIKALYKDRNRKSRQVQRVNENAIVRQKSRAEQSTTDQSRSHREHTASWPRAHAPLAPAHAFRPRAMPPPAASTPPRRPRVPCGVDRTPARVDQTRGRGAWSAAGDVANAVETRTRAWILYGAGEEPCSEIFSRKKSVVDFVKTLCEEND